MESVTCMHPVTKPGAECKRSEGRGVTRLLGEQPGQGARSSPLPIGLSFTEVQPCSLAHMLSVAAFPP